jgi:hypothetical protein
MGLHDRRFFLGQFAGHEQDDVRDANLADIVEIGASLNAF